MDNRNILFFISGLVVGAGSMYLALNKRFNDLLNEEVEDTKKYYELKFEGSKEKVEEAEEDIEDIEPDTPQEPNYGEIIEKLNYNQYSTKTSEDAPKSTSKIAQKPYIISNDQYLNDVEYDKYLLSYFSEDEVLIDAQTDEVIEDIDRIVGFDNLEQITMVDSDELCIRNEVEGCDYRVVHELCTYESYLSGGL